MGYQKQNYLEVLDFTETGNWNTAQNYSQFFIFEALAKASIYEEIAEFGTLELSEQLMMQEDIKSLIRIKAMEKIISKYKQVIDSTKFSMREGDQKLILTLRGRLEVIKKELLDKTYFKQKNFDEKRIKIDEKNFDKVLEILKGIRRDLLTPLNNADLIYTHKEDFDPLKFKKQIKKKLETSG